MGLITNISKQIYQDVKREYDCHTIHAKDAIIFLTYRCTSRCKTCNIWKWGQIDNEELSWNEWKKILVKMRDYGIRTVEIFGGDALLRKDVIFKMIDFCSLNDITTYFPTNSILLDKETAENLVKAGLNTLYFSLDDIGLDNDKIRGINDTFSKVKGALENIVNERKTSKTPKIIICTTISKLNYNHFEDIVEFLSHYPVDAIYPRVLGEFTQENIESSSIDGISPKPFFVSTQGVSNRLSQDEYEEFRKIIKKLKKTSKKPYINFRAFDETDENVIINGDSNIDRCLMCATVPIISPSGKLFPCLSFRGYELGDLIKDDLSIIWGNDKHKKFVAMQREQQIPICKNCISRCYYPSLSENGLYYKKRF